jgi:hypothetical protein
VSSLGGEFLGVSLATGRGVHTPVLPAAPAELVRQADAIAAEATPGAVNHAGTLEDLLKFPALLTEAVKWCGAELKAATKSRSGLTLEMVANAAAESLARSEWSALKIVWLPALAPAAALAPEKRAAYLAALGSAGGRRRPAVLDEALDFLEAARRPVACVPSVLDRLAGTIGMTYDGRHATAQVQAVLQAVSSAASRLLLALVKLDLVAAGGPPAARAPQW